MDEKDTNDKIIQSLESHSKIILSSFVVGLWITAVLMFLIMIAGIFRIIEGVFLEFTDFHNHDSSGLIKIFNGLELVFIAPLFYLLVLSLTKYISATRPEINPDLSNKRIFMNNAILELMIVKTLTISLFISILFLHSISHILQDSMTTSLLIYIISLLIILISYYFILDHLAEKLRKIS